MTEQQNPRDESQQLNPAPSNEQETRQWAIAIHASALGGFLVPVPFGTVVLPLLIWLLKKNDLPRLDVHGKAAVNFQITVALAFIVCLVLMIVVVGFILLPVLAIYALVDIILNTVRASNGEPPRYLLNIRFLK